MAAMAIPTALQIAGTVLSVVGGMNQARAVQESARINAENARIAAEANKRQLEYTAGQERAAGQHEAEAKRRKAALMLSRAQAVAAASGAGPLDESLIGGLFEAGERDAYGSMYSSEEKAKGLEYRGEVGLSQAIAQGEAEKRKAKSVARGTLLSTFGNALSGMSRFAPGAPPTAGNYQVGTPGYSGNYLEYDA